MKRHLLLSAVLAALLAALLGACGGDDNKDNSNAQAPISLAPGPTAPADTGATGTTGKQTKSGSKKSEKADKKADKKAESAEFEVIDKSTYVGAKRICKKGKLEYLKFTYKPKGTSAKAIAKAVSVRYIDPPGRRARRLRRLPRRLQAALRALQALSLLSPQITAGSERHHEPLLRAVDGEVVVLA